MSSQAARIARRRTPARTRRRRLGVARRGRRAGRRPGGGARRRGTPRRGGPRVHAAAAPRRHHPSAGLGQGPRPGADRRGDLRGVALPRSDLSRRGTGPDADHARDGRVHRPALGRQPLHAGRPGHAPDQHRLRRLFPALPDRSLRGQRGRRSRRIQRRTSRTSTAGSTRRAGWRASRSGSTCRSPRPGRT